MAIFTNVTPKKEVSRAASNGDSPTEEPVKLMMDVIET